MYRSGVIQELTINDMSQILNFWEYVLSSINLLDDLWTHKYNMNGKITQLCLLISQKLQTITCVGLLGF